MASCSMDTRDIVVESFNGTALVSPVSRDAIVIRKFTRVSPA